MRIRPKGLDESANHNVRLTFLYTLLTALSNGILFTGATALYVYFIAGKSNAKVGYSEGIFGAAALVPGVVGGYLADRTRRDRIILFGGIISFAGCAALVVLCSTLLADDGFDHRVTDDRINGIGSWKFLLVCIGVSVVYMGESVADASGQAIFADSIKTGARDEIMGELMHYSFLLGAIGPVVNLLIFLACGNDWSETTLTIIVIVGLAVRLPSVLLCFWFDDNLALDKESEARKLAVDVAAEAEAEAAGAAAKVSTKYRSIPIIYFVSDITVFLGSGMSVKFFPIFFQDNPDSSGSASEGLDLSPALVMGITTLLPLGYSLATKFGLFLCPRLGRVYADITVSGLGTLSEGGMVLVGYMGLYNGSNANRVLVVILFLLRCCLLNGVSNIQKSVIFDYVPKNQRGVWAGLDAISAVGWCGSAAVGGYLVEKVSFRFVFFITFSMHVLALLPRFYLATIVPRDEDLALQKKKETGSGPRKVAAAVLAARQRHGGGCLSDADVSLVARFAGPHGFLASGPAFSSVANPVSVVVGDFSEHDRLIN
ncbi:hypothetical protein DIPPA_02295 [Diplonema papillatum]|nr:hypothetical protein DIPPA_02295 [Diplonema papillatum]|eukprot:gene10303-15847_t